MKCILIAAVVTLSAGLMAQETEKLPSFEIADVHPSVKGERFREAGTRGRYEVRNFGFLNLVVDAYGPLTFDKTVGGPSWVQLERYDVTAKIPPDTPVEAQKLMLRRLLAERFGLKVHFEKRGVPAYALLAGRKPLLHEGNAAGESGCKAHTIPSPKPGEDPNTIFVGPGSTVTYTCQNVSMDSFATNLGRFLWAGLRGLTQNETGIQGNWTFDVSYSIPSALGLANDEGQRISISDAVEQQLGLKLEPREVPTPVLVIDEVNRTPTPNPPGVAEALPPIAMPKEFEVASIKPADASDGRRARSDMQVSGRYICDRYTLRALVEMAFDADNREQVQNVPAFAQSDRYDITAKATLPAGYAHPNDSELLAPLIRRLLEDRFKMTYHTEKREVTAYALIAAKPKLKKADPSVRSRCLQFAGPAGSPPGTFDLKCQNLSLAQFAEQLGNWTSEFTWPVEDRTGMEGGWDFDLVYTMARIATAASAKSDGTQAADPTGGYTIFEAIERQLGLKFEKVKRMESVTVIDHLEQRPAEN